MAVSWHLVSPTNCTTWQEDSGQQNCRQFFSKALPRILAKGKLLPVAGSCITFSTLNERVRAQLCQSCCDPLDCSPPGSSVRGILQARILEWVARDQTWVSCIAGRFFTQWDPGKPLCTLSDHNMLAGRGDPQSMVCVPGCPLWAAR